MRWGSIEVTICDLKFGVRIFDASSNRQRNPHELQIIQTKIHTLRGEPVMLDFDLAELYAVQTKRLKEAVRSNMDRFPAEFMFELTSGEFKNLRSQFATPGWGGSRYPPSPLLNMA